MEKLQNDFDEANSNNHNENLFQDYDKYLENEKQILNRFKEAKHRLYDDRTDAQLVANRFSNGTDSLTVRGLVKVLERYEDELLENNRRLNDDMAEYLRIIPRSHYHVGVASTFGTMFGMLLSFLAFIIIKKFKHRNDPVKYNIF